MSSNRRRDDVGRRDFRTLKTVLAVAIILSFLSLASASMRCMSSTDRFLVVWDLRLGAFWIGGLLDLGLVEYSIGVQLTWLIPAQ